MTQFYKAPCASYLGQDLYEFTSSGLTHTCNRFKICREAVRLMTSSLNQLTLVNDDMNFGIIHINQTSDDLLVQVTTRGLTNEVLHDYSFSVNQM